MTRLARPDCACTVVSHVEGYARWPAPRASGYGWEAEQKNFAEHAYECGRETIDDGYHGVFSAVGAGGAGSGPFPFNFELEETTVVQLIIGKESSFDARDMLESFDLEICTTAYDGSVFHIPSPRATLSGKTDILPQRWAIMEEWLRALEEAGVDYHELGYHGELFTTQGDYDEVDERAVDVLQRMSTTVWAAVGLDDISSLRCPYKDEAGTTPEIILCSFIQKLFMRLEKYDERGIQISNAPAGAFEYVPFSVSGEHLMLN
jgi:hypothetical protein